MRLSVFGVSRPQNLKSVFMTTLSEGAEGLTDD